MDKLIVTIAGLIGIAGIYWFFFGKKDKATEVHGSITITVEGGYKPKTIKVAKDKVTTLIFLRKDANSCLEDLIIPDFKIKAGEKNLELRVLVDEKCRIVFGDRVKLREIVTNLLGNSLKFTPSGWIEIKLSNNNGSFIKFEISDTGKGIDHNDLDRLFKKFGRIDNSYQTVAEAGGTGLGLYIVKNMVESMGGQVGAESEGVGKGSKFWFTLPGEYYEVPESLRESAIFTLAPLAETEITSICPV